MSPLTPPALLTVEHDCERFDCGERSLNDWLKRRAQEGQRRGAARTYVVCRGDDSTVVGYYSLSAGSVIREEAPGSLRRNMPDPVPVIVLGRLAVDTAFQGSGLGSALLKDAMLRALGAAAAIGAAALVVHALDDDLRAYYLRHGFAEHPSDSLVFYLPMRTIAAALTER